jgi:4-amino-4-deoxy-L-arabinose transferase-like glycosyltransferase
MLFIIGFVLRIGFIFVSKSYINPNDWEYGEIARNLITGNGYARATGFNGSLELTSSHAPLYPYFLSVFYNLGQKIWVFIIIQFIQAFLSSLIILIFYKTALLLFNKSAAVLTSIGITLYPPLIYYCAKLTPTTFFIFLLSLTILLIFKIKKDNLISKILPGIMLGLSILCNPLALTIFPALIIWHFIKRKISLKDLILIIITSLIILVPWTIRNYSLHHHIIPVTTQFGVNFWIGNNPNATGTDYYKVYSIKQGNFVLMDQTLPRKVKNELSRKSEIARSKFFLNQGIKFIKQNPIKFLRLLLKKCHYFWWFAPSQINASSLSRKFIKNTLLIILIIFFISSIYIITHVGLIRYRIPLEIYLIMFGCFAVFNSVKYFIGKT